MLVLTDPGLAAPRSVVDVAAAALQGGARAIQLRDKDSDARALLELAVRMRALTRGHDALLFVNDRFDVAMAAGADGVHLGPEDLPVAVVRRHVPRRFYVGYSTDDPVEARAAVEAGADYLGCGTVFPTTHKVGAGDPIGPEGLATVAAAVPVPVLGIGGITIANVALLASTGAVGAAVMGAVMSAEDPEAATRALVSATREFGRSQG